MKKFYIMFTYDKDADTALYTGYKCYSEPAGAFKEVTEEVEKLETLLIKNAYVIKDRVFHIEQYGDISDCEDKCYEIAKIDEKHSLFFGVVEVPIC